MSLDLKELFGVENPAIAMASVGRDVDILTRSGFDGILFCNEGDRPYQLEATFEGVAMMARVVAKVAPRDRPFGVAPNAGRLLRHRRELNAASVGVFMNITPEFASSLGTRDIATTARSVSVSSLADAILVSGPMAGAEPAMEAAREAKRGCGDETPVFANTGVKSSNARDFLTVADGVIVGSDLKVDGGTWNPVDPDRANRFMTEVRAVRETPAIR